MCQTWATDGLDRGPSNPSIRAGHLPASSLINRLSTSLHRHFVPVSLRARVLSTSTSLTVCLSVILPVCSNSPAPASCLSGREPPPVSLPRPLHPSEDTRKQSLRSQQPRISSRGQTAPSAARTSSRRKIATEPERTATRSSAASPPHSMMAESSSADAGETRHRHLGASSGYQGAANTRTASAAG